MVNLLLNTRQQLQRTGVVVAWAAISWWLFMAFHELGHIFSATINGGRIEYVDLHPFRFSQTIATGSPQPLMDVWMGPVFGTALPFLLHFASVRFVPAIRYYTGYLAGFCAIANGIYIGVSWMVPGHADAHELLRLGAPAGALIAFGMVTVPLGLYAWHREVAAYRRRAEQSRPTMTPAVDKRVLLFLAGMMWLVVGAYLMRLAWIWLAHPSVVGAPMYIGTGIFAALIIHHFGFLKVVDRNLGRILPMEGKRCVFSFMSWRSYILVALMIAMGAGLRHSQLPKTWLSVLYIAIGLSLCLSSIRYLRVLVSQSRQR